jgi:hypothetical protein
MLIKIAASDPSSMMSNKNILKKLILLSSVFKYIKLFWDTGGGLNDKKYIFYYFFNIRERKRRPNTMLYIRGRIMHRCVNSYNTFVARN